MSANSLPKTDSFVNPLDAILHRLEAHHGQPAKRSGDGYSTRCPAHEDRHASLSVTEADDGRVLICCHAGCTVQAIMQALGLPMSDLFPRREPERKRKPAQEPKPAPVPTYIYTDAAGEPVHGTLREAGKRFVQARADAASPTGWFYGLGDIEPVLYRLPDVLQAVADGRTIYVCEGEKDCDNLHALGLTATTNPMGACKWRKQYSEQLRGADVVILPDHDDPGEKHAAQVATALHDVADRVRVLLLPELPEKGDVSDWLEAGGTVEALQALADNCEAYTPPAPEAATAAEGAVLFDPGDPSLHYTDSGLAERLIRLYGTNLRHCWGRGQWLQWTGTHWLSDDGSEVHRMAGEVPRAMLRAAADIRDPEDRGPAVKFAIASESSVKRSAAVSLARSIRGVPVAPEALDANLWILNCANGTVDLRTGDLLPHRREDLCTRMAPVAFDPEARLDLWDRFLEEATGGDGDLVRFLAQVAGMALTGDTSAEVFAFVYGPTRSGKSSFLSALINTLGPYAHVADFASFCTGPAATPGAHRDDVAAMESRRLVVAAETSKGKGFDAGTLKNMTGGDVVNARPAYGRTRNFKPQFTLMLAANDRPRADDLDEALWRRLLEVPFRHTVPADRVDPSMKARLSDPGDGGPAVLAWAVAGCLDWQENGLTIPAAVAEASAEYRADVDPLAEFLLDCCVLAPEAQAAAGTLYETYREYALANGMKPMGNRAFGKRLSARGLDVSVVREGTKAQRIRRGIGLLDVEMLR